MNPEVSKTFGNRLRIRVCGLCLNGDTILMVNHRGLYGHDFWLPPGGGVEFGMGAKESLAVEFKEETGLDVEIGKLLFAYEFIQTPLHAIELFFDVRKKDGIPKAGHDPELPPEHQIITGAAYLTREQISKIPENEIHGIFKTLPDPMKIRDLQGYHTISKDVKHHY